MIHVTANPENKLLKYSINKLGVLQLEILSAGVSADNESFTSVKEIKQLLTPSVKPGSYQSQLASLLYTGAKGDNKKVAIELNYINPIKATGKPNRFEVQLGTII